MPSFDTPGRRPAAPLETLEHDDYLALRAGATGAGTRPSRRQGAVRWPTAATSSCSAASACISSAAWYPYAKRFADNALALAERKIPCPRVIGPLPHPGRAPRCRTLPSAGRGRPCASWSAPARRRRLRAQLGRFVAGLHEAGDLLPFAAPGQHCPHARRRARADRHRRPARREAGRCRRTAGSATCSTCCATRRTAPGCWPTRPSTRPTAQPWSAGAMKPATRPTSAPTSTACAPWR
jgi:hypothetical protein